MTENREGDNLVSQTMKDAIFLSENAPSRRWENTGRYILRPNQPEKPGFIFESFGVDDYSRDESGVRMTHRIASGGFDELEMFLDSTYFELAYYDDGTASLYDGFLSKWMLPIDEESEEELTERFVRQLLFSPFDPEQKPFNRTTSEMEMQMDSYRFDAAKTLLFVEVLNSRIQREAPLSVSSYTKMKLDELDSQEFSTDRPKKIVESYAAAEKKSMFGVSLPSEDSIHGTVYFHEGVPTSMEARVYHPGSQEFYSSLLMRADGSARMGEQMDISDQAVRHGAAQVRVQLSGGSMN